MAKERLANEIHIITRVIGFLIVSLKQSINSMRNTLNYDYSESTKQMEQTLRAKVKIFFKSENLKKCF